MNALSFERGSYHGEVIWALCDGEGALVRISGEPWGEWRIEKEVLERSYFLPLPPCAPSKILAVGANFPEHGVPSRPSIPSIFQKPISSIVSNGGEVKLPGLFGAVAVEGELGVVVGRRLRFASQEEARKSIGAFVVANDISGREPTQEGISPSLVKGCDTFLPLSANCVVGGEWRSMKLVTCVNDLPCQTASLVDMCFTPEDILVFLSSLITLLPGDLVLMGTPSPKPLARSGDRVRVSISNVGFVEHAIGRGDS